MTLQEFRTKVKNIHPEGNIDNAYKTIDNLIEFGTRVDGQMLSYDIVILKYSSYVKSWNLKGNAKKQASGYLAKDKELRTIDMFVNDGMYNQDFQSGITNIERDMYLFGDNVEELIKRFKNAEQIIEREKNKFL